MTANEIGRLECCHVVHHLTEIDLLFLIEPDVSQASSETANAVWVGLGCGLMLGIALWLGAPWLVTKGLHFIASSELLQEALFWENATLSR